MSAPGPESISTLADPRSRRPTKKLKPTAAPSAHQASSLATLFARPIEAPFRLNASSAPANKHHQLRAPPEVVSNVQGSSAGAGSGEFHVYKAARRREYARLRAMEEEVQREKEQEDFEASRLVIERADEEKTNKNREKRRRKETKRAQDKGKQQGGKKEGECFGAGDTAKGGALAQEMRYDRDGEQGTEPGTQNGAGQGEQGKDLAPAAPNESGLIIYDDD